METAKEHIKIIIAEDQGLIRHALSSLLKRVDGFEVVGLAANGTEVLKLLETLRPDIILMDISINGEMNGLELTKELKMSKELSHIPVIAITAHAFEEDKQNALDAGCAGFLAKPFTKESLLEIIKVFVYKPI